MIVSLLFTLNTRNSILSLVEISPQFQLLLTQNLSIIEQYGSLNAYLFYISYIRSSFRRI